MRFEGRELTTCAEPVSSRVLKEGDVYFSVQYADENLLVPIVETLVFVGRYIGSDGVNRLRFQDIGSHSQGIRYGSPGAEEACFQSPTEDGIKHIFEYEGALDELMRCAIRRRKPSP